MKLNEKGFTLVEGLLVAVLIAVIGFGGYYVWNENQDEETSMNEEISSSEENVQTPPENTDESNTSLSEPETQRRVNVGQYSFDVQEDWRVEEGAYENSGSIYNYEESEATGSGQFPEGKWKIQFHVFDPSDTSDGLDYIINYANWKGDSSQATVNETIVYTYTDNSGFGQISLKYVELEGGQVLWAVGYGDIGDSEVNEFMVSFR